MASDGGARGVRAVMLGLPGAGKGTQAERLAGHLGVPRISTGDIFRQAVREQTSLGRQAQAYLERGELVPDEVTVGVVLERLRAPDCREGFVLDGFPRNLTQARRLDEALAGLGQWVDAAIYLSVPEEMAVRRITSRRVCARCGSTYSADAVGPTGNCPKCAGPLVQRPDDREEVVRQRLRVYESETRPLLEYYRTRGIRVDVDGTGTVEEVFRALLEALRQRGLVGAAMAARRPGSSR